jgi:hypothetical protein
VSTASTRPSKKLKADSVPSVCASSPKPQQYPFQPIPSSGSRAESTYHSTNPTRSGSPTANSPVLLKRTPILLKRPPLPLSSVVKNEPLRKHIELPTTAAPREYDALGPPGSEETHRYIASSRLIQKTALVKALLDPDCGRASFVERDFEYLRVTKKAAVL